jgi:hypothetical protein
MREECFRRRDDPGGNAVSDSDTIDFGAVDFFRDEALVADPYHYLAPGR